MAIHGHFALAKLPLRGNAYGAQKQKTKAKTAWQLVVFVGVISAA